MSFKRTALPATLSALAALLGSYQAHAASVEIVSLGSVSHTFQSIGLSAAAQGGILLSQAITENGDDAGTTRIDTSFDIRYQEYDNGNHDLAEEVNVASFIGSLSDLGVTGESGSFTMSAPTRASTYTLQFQNSYENPVVFVQAVTQWGADPVSVVPFATSGDFAIIGMPEGATSDGVHHAVETIHYVVIEAGTYHLGGWQYLEAGVKTVTTSDYWSTGMSDITPTGATFYDATNPLTGTGSAFFAQPQSAGAATYRGARVSHATGDYGALSFSARHMLDDDLEDAGTTAPTTATIGYLAVGTGTLISSLSATYNPPQAVQIVEVTNGTATSSCTDVGSEEWLVGSSASYGNSRFAAGYEATAGIGGESMTDYDFWMGAVAGVDVTVLGTSKRAVDLGAYSVVDGSDEGSWAYLDVLGVNIWGQNLSVSFEKEFTRTFVEGQANFYGFVVKGEAVGALGFEGSLSVTGNDVVLEVTPYANATAAVTVGVGGWCAIAGIQGSVFLIEANVPVTGTFSLPTTDEPYIQWSYGADLELATLDGSVSLVAEICGVEAEHELFSWSGVDLYATELMSGSGCL